MEEAENMDDIAVNQLHAGDGDGADIVFSFNGNPISVSIFPTNGLSTKDSRHLDLEDRPLQDRLIDIISRATMCEGDDNYDELEDKVLGVILDAGKSHFTQTTAAEETRQVSSYPSLHGFLFPAIRYYRLEAATGDVSIVPISPSEAYTCLAIDPVLDGCVKEELGINESLPRYVPEQIAITKIFLQGVNSVTASVQVDGQDMFCKSHGGVNGLFGTSEGRELECLDKIRRASAQQGKIRAPQILGYIHHKETKRILGFLREWLPGRLLSDIYVSTTAVETRQKWISQIRETVQRLHKEGLVWGDGKTSNIIIDERENAWLIDFGGGFTDGWVDEELAETIEGDEQAVGKIVEFLSDGDSVIRSPGKHAD